MNAGSRVRRLTLSLALSIALSVIPAAGLDFPALATSLQPSALVVVDGKQLPAVPGTMFKAGTPTATGCTDVNYRVGVLTPSTYGYGRVVLNVDDACVATIEEVVFEREARLPSGTTLGQVSNPSSWMTQTFGPLGFAAQAATQRRVWGRHLMHEQFHFTTTLVYQDFTYWETADSVYGPSPYSQYCWQDGFGWTIEECTAVTELDGPTHVQRNTRGVFVNSCCGGIRHNLGTHPYALVNWFNYWCDTVGYSMPFGWHDHCEGARVY
jgi:hypothetical protein